MFSVADLLDRAKARAGIETDYRLCKVIGINHQVISGYRLGKSMPNEKILSQLCALSGDDVAVMAAEIQAARAQSDEGKSMWMMIAKRLAGGASTAILSVLFALGLVASMPHDAYAKTGQDAIGSVTDQVIHRIKYAFCQCYWFAAVRLRQFAGLFKLAIFACS